MKRCAHILLMIAIATAATLQTSCKKEEPAKPVLIGLELTQTELTLTEGDEAVLTAQLDPADFQGAELLWSSANEAAATVDQNGKVTAVAEGKTQIKVTAPAWKLEAVCEVTVKKLIIPVTGITISPDGGSLVVDETLQLTATVLPENATDKSILWSSDHPGIAEVENGKVTAISAGTAIITAKAQDKTATCTITVQKKIIPVSGLTLDKTSATLETQQTLQLNANVAPSDATNKNIVWTSSETSVATVSDNGLVSAKADGTTTITAKITDDTKEWTATCSIEVIDFHFKTHTKSYYCGEQVKFSTTVENVIWSISRKTTLEPGYEDKTEISKAGELTLKQTVTSKEIHGRPTLIIDKKNVTYIISAQSTASNKKISTEIESVFWEPVFFCNDKEVNIKTNEFTPGDMIEIRIKTPNGTSVPTENDFSVIIEDESSLTYSEGSHFKLYIQENGNYNFTVEHGIVKYPCKIKNVAVM